MDDVSPEMKRILDYIDGKGASDKFTEELEEAVCSARQNERTPPASSSSSGVTRSKEAR